MENTKTKKMSSQRISHLRGFRILLIKAYFDKGFGVLNYFKYLIALFGLATLDAKAVSIVIFVYVIACFIVGYLWYKYEIIETEVEIGNIFNPFVKEMRRKI